MQYFFQNHNARELIIFFAGWGCDYNQFANLQDRKDVLILCDYQDWSLDFDFSKYDDIYVIAYSAGVFVASVMADKIPNVRKKVALCGNPYLFDERLGISANTIRILKNITLDNYLDFRRRYMVFSDDEYVKYNRLECVRTIESCANELTALQQAYSQKKTQINPEFDQAYAAENDLIFNLAAQKDFYQDKLTVIPHARHHIFFRFGSFEEILTLNRLR